MPTFRLNLDLDNLCSPGLFWDALLASDKPTYRKFVSSIDPIVRVSSETAVMFTTLAGWDSSNPPLILDSTARDQQLLKYLDGDADLLDEPMYSQGWGDHHAVEYNGQAWLIYSKEERDAALEEALTNYLKTCILADDEVPEFYREYFDADAWKSDQRRQGYGKYLGPYEEFEHDIGRGYYAYKG